MFTKGGGCGIIIGAEGEEPVRGTRRKKTRMTIREMQEEILRLKTEKDVCILAHTYQSHEVTEIADFVGDSFQLSLKAKSAPQGTVLMCGVRFMAETVKLLAPEKTVYLSSEHAGCPMAEQLTPGQVRAEKKKYPGCMTVAYINTTAELKAEADVCVTSSSAAEIVKKLPAADILFIPDVNLGAYVQAKCPEKRLHFMNGCCPVHASVTAADADAAKAKHPGALFLAHPECRAEVLSRADYVGSTAGITDYVKNSACREFIIGTETSVAVHLGFEYPDRRFYPLSAKLVCRDMKATSLPDVYRILKEGGRPLELDAALLSGARGCLDRMLALG